MYCREVFEAWETAKKDNMNASIKVEASKDNNTALEKGETWETANKDNMNATIKVEASKSNNTTLEKRDLILVSKIMTVATNDLEKLPAILEATKTELVDELKKKALAANCKDITDFKIEIHSVSEGIFLVIIYATTVKF